MGDPKKIKNKYSAPIHPWQGERIVEEISIMKEYGLKNKQEIWKAASLLRNFSKQAKKLTMQKTDQSQKEQQQLLKKLQNLGLLPQEANLDNVLGLTLKNILERRLQTLVYKKELAKSVSQARQFIVHGHITINSKKITVPSYLVLKEEEPLISFISTSGLANIEHPERRKGKKDEK